MDKKRRVRKRRGKRILNISEHSDWATCFSLSPLLYSVVSCSVAGVGR
jgi:hypothetical protein